MRSGIFIFAIFSILLFVSCEEDFQVKSELKQGYVLNCIIRGDTIYHVATISRTYNQFGVTPSQDTTDKSIKNAEISLVQRGIEYKFLEGTKQRSDTSRYNFPVNYYYVENFSPEREEYINLKAILSDGTVLTSETQIPEAPTIDYLLSDDVIPTDYNDSIFVAWQYTSPDFLFDARLNIVYYKNESGTMTRYIKQVPLGYQSNGGLEVPFYSAPSFHHYIQIYNGFIDKAMQEISGEDPNKSNYYISRAYLQLYTYDQNLSSYFITSNYLDPYSIRLDEVDGSNVEGGYGIFGSFICVEHKMTILPGYTRSFGYVPYIRP